MYLYVYNIKLDLTSWCNGISKKTCRENGGGSGRLYCELDMYRRSTNKIVSEISSSIWNLGIISQTKDR